MKPPARTLPHALRHTHASAAAPRRAPGRVGGRLLLVWLLCALLVAPLLGHLHALAHPGAQGHEAHGGAHPHAPGGHSAEPIAHTLADLLAEHPSSADCQLFDHLALADAAPSAAGATSSPPPPALPVQAARTAPATAHAAQYHARGPPGAVQSLVHLG